jgi:glycosidase
MVFDNESAHPCDYVAKCNGNRPSDKVQIDQELLTFYKKLTSFRHRYSSLRRGSFKTVHVDDERQLFAFERALDGERVLAIFNGSDRTVKMPPALIDVLDKNEWQLLLGSESSRGIPAKGTKVYANR